MGPAPPSGRYRKKCEAEAEARRAFEADCAQRLEDAQRQKEQRLEEEYRQRGEALLAEKRLFEDRTRRDADVRPDTAAVGCASWRSGPGNRRLDFWECVLHCKALRNA